MLPTSERKENSKTETLSWNVKDQIQILNLDIDPVDKSNEPYNMFCHPTHNTGGGSLNIQLLRQNPTIFSTLFSGLVGQKMVTISINLSAHCESPKILLATFLVDFKKAPLYLQDSQGMSHWHRSLQRLVSKSAQSTPDPQMGRKCRQAPLLKQKEVIK